MSEITTSGTDARPTSHLWVVGLATASLVLVTLALCLGPVPFDPARAVRALSGDGPAWERTVILELRLPRLLVAAMVGWALATSGTALQSLFKNPLADPGVLGVSAGASLGAVLAIASGLAAVSASVLPMSAALGAALAALLLVGLATSAAERTISLLVLGVALSSLLSAITALVVALSLADYLVAQQIVYWLMGGLEARTWDHVLGGLAPIALATVLLQLRARELDALQLGEIEASVLGIDVPRARLVLVLATAILVGTSVSIAGSIAFVGLLVPHAVRLVAGARHGMLVPLSGAVGALFVVAADLVARTALAPREIPVGVITALVGAPLLFALASTRSRA
ncbi:MAG: iron ABC transporter permease [Sandaracinaceae bacterium]|nr:iron ABC transporter permease [Sandaracinaceae bacterium]